VSAELPGAQGRRRAGRPARLRLPAALLAGALCMLLPLGVQAQWLVDLHRRALALDPAVQGAEAQFRAADERVLQARASFGPTASASYSQNSTRYREEPDNALRPFSATQYGLQVTQPLIRTALVPALEGAQAQRDQAGRALAQARTDAGLRLIEAVFDLLKARDALAQADAQRLAADEQLASARRSFQVGRATVVDVRDAEGRIATVTAQRAAAAADLRMRRGLLEDLVGTAGPAVRCRCCPTTPCRPGWPQPCPAMPSCRLPSRRWRPPRPRCARPGKAMHPRSI
jgi:outer membrane protein